KVEFVLTEKKRNIPKNTLYYYEIDGYYFCVISISDIDDDHNLKGDTMKFTFEALQDDELIGGSSYFMDFGNMESQEDAVLAEGRLLSAFGEPVYSSENYENSFIYVIRATAESGESVILSVYGMGVVHIGAIQQDEFAEKAANALIKYVNTFAPTDYSRTVYYLDCDLQLDIQVKNGKVTLAQSELSAEKFAELSDKWYS
ncbi:MAG: hypothetical protein J6B12_02085, partial [Clostridia bacterium]|nr:hypothetical protein [Clostridia bacterium]